MANLRDDWDDEGGPQGPEAVSWKYHNPGDIFTGVVVPPNPLTAPDKGYVIQQRRGKGRDKRKDAKTGPLVWPAASDENRGPMTENEFARAFGDDALKTADGVVIKVTTLVTNHTNQEFFGIKSKDRARELGDAFVDNGMRRLFIDGVDIPEKVRGELDRIGQRAIVPGMTISVKFDKREPNKGGAEGETNRFLVRIDLPTEETKALVAKHITEAKSTEGSARLDDPWAGGTGGNDSSPSPFGGGDEEPPF
jgi:hypothetical protein